MCHKYFEGLHSDHTTCCHYYYTYQCYWCHVREFLPDVRTYYYYYYHLYYLLYILGANVVAPCVMAKRALQPNDL